VLSRGLATRVNLVNATGLAAQRNLGVSESREPRSGAMDTIQVALETDRGVTTVTGGVLLEKPRLLSVDGIAVEITLGSRLVYMRNVDVPGVIGHVGTVLGRNSINIANFSLGRQDAPAPGEPLYAVALVEIDSPVPAAVLDELKSHEAVRICAVVEPGT
jgi:D-3-phosphoglycerate dehydrogenase